MPLFNWLRDEYGLARNYYDRVGHVFQGFVPAMIAREILLRRSPLDPGKWLFFTHRPHRRRQTCQRSLPWNTGIESVTARSSISSRSGASSASSSAGDAPKGGPRSLSSK